MGSLEKQELSDKVKVAPGPTIIDPEKVLERIDGLFASDLLPQNPAHFEETKLFLQQVVEILISYIKEEYDPNSKILEFHHPLEMAQIIDLSIPDKPMELTKLLQCCRDVLKLGVRTGHPRFFNQISCGLDLVSMAGEWLTATCNTNMFTYEIAPVFILMEKEIIQRMIELIGWPAGEGDAIFSPGGAIANLYAMNAARHHHFPRAKPLGMTSVPTLCAFTSEDCHYSIKGAAAVLGIGTDNCFSIPTDYDGRMIPEALEQKILKCKSEGLYPFFVCATAGTTVYGSWDPLPQIADVCARHKVWMHVDAAWGGGLLLSPEHRHKLAGIERAQSVTWNPHKLMGALLQCSAIFIRYEGLLFQTNQQSADYLFQQDKPYDCNYDTGDKAMQCGRHNDIFKLWLMWRSKGMEGYRRQINRLMQLASYFTQKIQNTEGYEMVINQPQFLNVCFWYVPQSLRDLDPKEKAARLEKIAPKIKQKMMERGTTMVGYQPDLDKKRPNFFRMIISNQAITEADLDFLVDEIIRIGKDL
ncbi:pyridoxal-dependent decarboxylase conserved domain-containing protein [Ditylenchus destructor]|uniref:Pyridoxal-dependent decarboxylase conserved domain-containing protein n=1 Tax=Ditylenchus destructor TaxID=166010 RepID=A0AAD4NH24_9BILA|nr:pyridoxal-dependent decarboxylase conserved domain-containing protein [Ditylenchus destructor]